MWLLRYAPSHQPVAFPACTEVTRYWAQQETQNMCPQESPYSFVSPDVFRHIGQLPNCEEEEGGGGGRGGEGGKEREGKRGREGRGGEEREGKEGREGRLKRGRMGEEI